MRPFRKKRSQPALKSTAGSWQPDYIGIYAIYVSPSCWRRGYARAICSTILKEARLQGARYAYLQVVKGNTAAKKLYQSLGFQDFYTYWFRSKALS